MPSAPTLDLDALLAPVSEEKPCGEDQRFLGPYDEIQEARREDVGAQGDWQREMKTADWRKVVQVGTDVLLAKAKDIQVAAWMTEALVHEQGFAGLRDGLALLRRLQETYWDDLYPGIDDGDLELRGAPLEWLGQRLGIAINTVAITQGAGEREYSLLDYSESRVVDNLSRQSVERYEAAIADGKITGEQFDAGFMGTPRAFYERVAADLAAAGDESAALMAVVLERFGAQAPAISGIGEAITQGREVLDRLLEKKRELEPDPVEEEEGEAGAAAGGTGRRGAQSAEPRDRKDALQRLRVVAAYFRRTEPQSPVAYLVERAVKWADMPLEDWLFDVIGGDNALYSIKSTLGIKDPNQS